MKYRITSKRLRLGDVGDILTSGYEPADDCTPEQARVWERARHVEAVRSDLADRTVAELRELADTLGVEVSARATKAELVAAVEGA